MRNLKELDEMRVGFERFAAEEEARRPESEARMRRIEEAAQAKEQLLKLLGRSARARGARSSGSSSLPAGPAPVAEAEAAVPAPVAEAAGSAAALAARGHDTVVVVDSESE